MNNIDDDKEINMSTAHLYIFSDGCPSDWLNNGKDEEWHTIVNYAFQSDPSLQQQVNDMHRNYIDILDQDRMFCGFFNDLQQELSSGKLRKWHQERKESSKKAERYRKSFCRSFIKTIQIHKPVISACSFQEKILRSSKPALLKSYNAHIGGIEGRGIGFEEFEDSAGSLRMKHSFVNFHGRHDIKFPEDQMLIVMLMTWLIADQYAFYKRDIIDSKRYGFNHLNVTVISNTLSGDNTIRPINEKNLRNLIDPDGEGIPIRFTTSLKEKQYLGDLFVDNLAGWLNEAIINPEGEYAHYIRDTANSKIWVGWHMLLKSTTDLVSKPALSYITSIHK